MSEEEWKWPESTNLNNFPILDWPLNCILALIIYKKTNMEKCASHLLEERSAFVYFPSDQIRWTKHFIHFKYSLISFQCTIAHIYMDRCIYPWYLPMPQFCYNIITLLTCIELNGVETYSSFSISFALFPPFQIQTNCLFMARLLTFLLHYNLNLHEANCPFYKSDSLNWSCFWKQSYNLSYLQMLVLIEDKNNKRELLKKKLLPPLSPSP